MKKVLIISIILLSTLIFSFISIEAKELKIGFAHVALNCPYYLAMKATAEEKAIMTNLEDKYIKG